MLFRSVCKIMDYNKFKYESKKKTKENLKKQREANLEMKEYRLSVTIDNEGERRAAKNSGEENSVGKIARLRHGKVSLEEIPDFWSEKWRFVLQCEFSEEFAFASKVKIDDGKGNIYQAFFKPTKGAEGDYFCRFVGFPSAARSESESLAIKSLDYVTTVSAWTFTQIFGEQD